MKSLLIGMLAGFVFFVALSVAIVAGLREPYVTILIVIALAVVSVAAYVTASRSKREPDE